MTPRAMPSRKARSAALGRRMICFWLLFFWKKKRKKEER